MIKDHFIKLTFNLIIHDSFERKRLFCIFQLEVPSFLLQHLWILQGSRMQYRIQIYMDKVVEVFRVCWCDGVAGTILNITKTSQYKFI